MRPTTDLQRTVAPFEVVADFEPSGDQPTAIADLTKRIQSGEQDIVLLGATGTGKSATAAWLIEQVQRPTLVMAPNKTLAAQLANEFRELLPDNAVEYFVSYYDYYQPEAYIAQTDTAARRRGPPPCTPGCATVGGGVGGLAGRALARLRREGRCRAGALLF